MMITTLGFGFGFGVALSTISHPKPESVGAGIGRCGNSVELGRVVVVGVPKVMQVVSLQQLPFESSPHSGSLQEVQQRPQQLLHSSTPTASRLFGPS